MRKISKKTVALFAAALVLLGSGGVMGTRAVPGIQSDIFDTKIKTDAIAVQILDNSGAEVGVKDRVLTDNKLYTELGDTIVPGESYKSKVSVKNTGAADEYIRVVVRKYWTDDKGKNLKVDPELIELKVAESAGYKWTKVDETDETSIYYLSNPVAAGSDPVDLFSEIRINEEVVTMGRKVETSKDTKDGVTTINYSYEYDGLQFNVEAEAQSVQTHSAGEAIKSVWGVDAGSVGINL